MAGAEGVRESGGPGEASKAGGLITGVGFHSRCKESPKGVQSRRPFV